MFFIIEIESKIITLLNLLNQRSNRFLIFILAIIIKFFLYANFKNIIIFRTLIFLFIYSIIRIYETGVNSFRISFKCNKFTLIVNKTLRIIKLI